MTYLFFIVCIDVLVISAVIIMIAKNTLFEKGQKLGFLTSFSLILVLSIVEFITVLVEGRGPEFAWLNRIMNILGFMLSPFVPVFLGNSISQFKTEYSKSSFIILAIYDIFFLCTLPFGLVFSVSDANVYERGILFPVFLLIYLASKLYLAFSSYLMTQKFQFRNKASIIILACLFVVGSSLQIFFPDIHIVWFVITITSVAYYTYFNDLWGQMDKMTGLFNQLAYLNRASKLKPGETIILMDCDDFKRINDTYGHQQGDECLKVVANLIKTVYQSNGVCYRIGGDEFAVIVNAGVHSEIMNTRFELLLNKERFLNPIVPNVSIGFAVFHKGDFTETIKDKADRIMYNTKSERKSQYRHRVGSSEIK